MINKKEFENQTFKTHGVLTYSSEKGLNRVPNDWVPNNSISSNLREKIREIMWEKADEYRSTNNVKTPDSDFIELFCQIPKDTLKKAINGKYKITRNFLAKFTVGLKLEMEVANLLFRECSGELNMTNDFDYIVYNALKSKDDIDFFMNELREYTGINLDRER
jgi:hypothetical protein